ncbi:MULTISPECIES: hypothetical protein [Streptomyces]|uniref:hypothetical protein n=1 Tax=Streptomyces TaxID=1883 RepID=UPI0009404F22|nr:MULTISPECIES: hypothetical protein [Streptomyces]MCX0246505.1 hypothetical protein [Streptomyces drozdowiczii]OKJ72135.1 hypothetical protein AMK30_20330 [Streptomyces sp. CB02460]
MPLIPEEPQIHESAQGPRATPANGRAASTPRPVPGPRSAATPRPGRPVPGPRPAPPAQRRHSTSGGPQAAPSENRSAPQLQVIPASADGALDAADEAVDLLLDSGRAPGDILVLTTGGQHPWATHELSFGEAAYWAQHEAGDDVFFAAAAAADRVKPRPVVIVAVNGPADDASARALAKARESAGVLLIVCGDPQRINAALGAGV